MDDISVSSYSYWKGIEKIMQEYSKHEIIEKLIEYHIEKASDTEFVKDMMRHGFSGYWSMGIEELENIVNIVFGKRVLIVEN